MSHPPIAAWPFSPTFGGMTRWSKVRFTFLSVGLATLVCAQPQPGPAANAIPAAATGTNAPVKQISETEFALGQVRVNTKEKSVRFPATVNLREGHVEYLLVHASGKVHESVLKTAAEPFHIHTAMLLLGAKGGVVQTVSPEKKTSEVAGDQTTLYLSWPTNGVETVMRGESLIFNAKKKSPLSLGSWVYNGSRLIDGHFLAQRDGSVVSVIADPDALVNNPRPERDNDEIWLVNTNVIPPVNTPVLVTIKLEAK